MPASSGRGFSLLSPIYDALAGMIFGKSIKASQAAFIPAVASAKKVLILGGGTGYILERLLEESSAEKVLYVDIADGMIAKARGRLMKSGGRALSQVGFITGTIDDIPEGEKFDLVITQYFLDLFADAGVVMERIDRHLEPEALWLYADFRIVKENMLMRICSGMLIAFMYAFFRLCCGIEAGKLPDVEGDFDGLGFVKREEAFFFGKMIVARLYKRA